MSSNSAMLFAFVGGLLVAVQAAMNSHLRSFTPTPLVAAFLSFLVGAMVLCVLLALQGGIGAALRNTAGAASDIPWWAWLGGACGAGYVLSVIASVPHIGVALCIACVMLGQQLGALVIDHQGWMEVPRAPLDLHKLCAAGLILAGVWLLQRR
jgi:transporter family-2 protein